MNPNDAGAYMARGSCLYALGSKKAAIDDFTQVIRLEPENAVPYNNRGLARFESGDYTGALADYSQAIKIRPDYATASYNRGRAEFCLENYQSAIADLSRAGRQSGQDHAVRLYSHIFDALALRRMGDETSARQVLPESKQLDRAQGWPERIVAYLARDISLTQFLKSATNKSEQTQAHFYVAVDLWSTMREEARRHLAWIAGSGDRTLMEYAETKCMLQKHGN